LQTKQNSKQALIKMYEILREKNTVSVLKILLGDPEEWQFRFRTLRLKAFKVQE